ncbi:EscU/YscU/HrcU family type III secretion system export apparatus switch protein, partial [Kosakonia radicincitans]
MASEDNEDKTEAPTAHRLEKAREEGQIPRSKELTSLLVMLVGVCILWFGGEMFGRRLSMALSSGLRFDHKIINDPGLFVGQVIMMLKTALMGMLPLLTGVVIIALIAPVMLGGLVFSTKSLAFNFSKLNPLSGLGRLFSSQVGAELFKALMKALLMGSVAGIFVWHHWPDMMR